MRASSHSGAAINAFVGDRRARDRHDALVAELVERAHDIGPSLPDGRALRLALDQLDVSVEAPGRRDLVDAHPQRLGEQVAHLREVVEQSNADRKAHSSSPFSYPCTMLKDEAGRVAGDVIHAAWGQGRAVRRDGTTSSPGPAFHRFGNGSMIAFPATVIFGEGRIGIGEGTTIGPLASLSAGMPVHADLRGDPVITIGDRCTLGKGIGIVGHERIENRRRHLDRALRVRDRPEPRLRGSRPADRHADVEERARVDRIGELARPRRGRVAGRAHRPARSSSRRAPSSPASTCPTTPWSRAFPRASYASTNRGVGWRGVAARTPASAGPPGANPTIVDGFRPPGRLSLCTAG